MSTEWEELQGKVLDKEQIIVKLEAEKNILGEKVKKLKMKRDVMEKAMEDMRNKLYQLRGSMRKYARGEKLISAQKVQF